MLAITCHLIFFDVIIARFLTSGMTAAIDSGEVVAYVELGPIIGRQIMTMMISTQNLVKHHVRTEFYVRLHCKKDNHKKNSEE